MDAMGDHGAKILSTGCPWFHLCRFIYVKTLRATDIKFVPTEGQKKKNIFFSEVYFLLVAGN